MRLRRRRTVIAAGVVVAVVGAMAAVAALPRSGSAGGQLAIRGAFRPRSARVLSGSARTDTTETTQTPGETSTSVPDTTSPPTSTPGTPPGTTLSPSTTTLAATTTTAPVSTAGPATGRLVATVAVASANGGPDHRAIVTMAADGSDERVLATGNYIDPHWTPDGRYIVFASMDSFASWAVPAGGGPVTRLGDAAVSVISPDGTAAVGVLAVPYASGPPALTVQKIAETASGLVTVGPATPLGVSGVAPVWSPDGRRILYATEMGGVSGLAIINADGTGRHDLLGSAPVKAFGMDRAGFSADGSTISFLGNDSTVYFVGADGHGLRPALSGPIAGVPSLGAFVTSWSADHQRLAILVNGANSIVVIDKAGHVLATTHTTVMAFPVGIAFDGSGQYVYFMSGPIKPPLASQLYIAPLSGGPSRPVGTGDSAGFPLSVLAA